MGRMQAMNDVQHFDENWSMSHRPDFHAIVTIQLCELIEADFFDLHRADWDFGPKFSTAQHFNLCNKITAHYYYREIALVPPGKWKREFLRKMNEIMPKYIPLYKALDDGIAIGSESEYYKSRNIFSDFPQTALAGNNQDYASTGNDLEYERIKYLDPMELELRLREYNDVDLAIIDEIEPMFSCLLSLDVDGY